MGLSERSSLLDNPNALSAANMKTRKIRIWWFVFGQTSLALVVGTLFYYMAGLPLNWIWWHILFGTLFIASFIELYLGKLLYLEDGSSMFESDDVFGHDDNMLKAGIVRVFLKTSFWVMLILTTMTAWLGRKASTDNSDSAHGRTSIFLAVALVVAFFALPFQNGRRRIPILIAIVSVVPSLYMIFIDGFCLEGEYAFSLRINRFYWAIISSLLVSAYGQCFAVHKEE